MMHVGERDGQQEIQALFPFVRFATLAGNLAETTFDRA